MPPGVCHNTGMPYDPADALTWIDHPETDGPTTLLLALSGWMDGGEVSTGTVERIVDELNADLFAVIDPDRFSIFNFPGTMEFAAMFRPHATIDDGRLTRLDMPANRFYISAKHRLVLFVGHEPNLQWRGFGDAIFAVAREVSVSRVLFVGSYAGAVPHTREPRLYCTASDDGLREALKQYDVRTSSYDGPGSFITYLLSQARERGVSMASLVAEIPAYIEGRNPVCIESVTRRLATILGLPTDLAELRTASTEWEARVSDAVEENDELADKIRELEEAYDEDLVDTQTARGLLDGDSIDPTSPPG